MSLTQLHVLEQNVYSACLRLTCDNFVYGRLAGRQVMTFRHFEKLAIHKSVKANPDVTLIYGLHTGDSRIIGLQRWYTMDVPWLIRVSMKTRDTLCALEKFNASSWPLADPRLTNHQDMIVLNL